MRPTLLLLLLTLNAFAQPAPRYVITAPAGSAYTKIDKAGQTVLPNGRFITPRGRQIQTAPHPYGLVLSPDGKTVVTANSGINPFSISIVRDVLGANPVVRQIPDGYKTDNGILEACFMGLAISPDNRTVYVAGGETDKIFLFDLATGKPAGTINCAQKTARADYSHGYIGDMALTRDGKTLYALDQIGFRMIVIDVATKTIRHNVPTGRYPFGITLSTDRDGGPEKTAYVANVGVFEYKPFSDLDRKDLKRTAHAYPASKYGSKEMREGDAAKGIPALGDPNAPEAFSVWSISLAGTPVVTAKIKTGFLVGQMVEDFPAVGGSSPNSVVATDRYVFVSNGNNDCVSVIDGQTNAVVKNIALSPDPRLGNLRGVIPFGLALSPDGKRLFVAEAGINAVAVVDVPTLAVIGHIPTGWFPSKLKVSQDGRKLIVANAKGYGSGPNGGRTFKLGEQGSYIGSLMNGTVSVMDIPADADLKAETDQVIQNNFTIRPVAEVPRTSNPVPAFAGQKESPNGGSRNGGSPIKHIVFIAKENRTYDEIFGQLRNAEGDSTLARYGVGVTVKAKRGNQTVERASVMPNHHALARRFALSDNFYCDSDVSADGHRWLVNTYPNEWVETGTAAAYGGKRSMRDSSNAPGNLSFYGSAGSIYPEDYNEGGSMWDHLERWKKDFFNFGFGVEMAGAYSDSTMKYTGEKYTINYPLPAPLFDRTSRTFPTYNMAVPDQFRADVFMKEFKEKWWSDSSGQSGTAGGRSLPSVITLMLPNDHGTNPRPKAGFPFTESYMADNDLALGRVVEFLSQTPYWKNMAIFVVEDDPQGGVDHVDAHRSLLLAISPYVKRNYVGHVHYSFGSVFKTFWNVLGIPCLNQYDAGATDLADLFTDQPDFTPFRALPADVRLFDPQKALDPFDEKFDWKAFSESEELDRTETMQKRRAEEDKEGREKEMKPRKAKRSR